MSPKYESYIYKGAAIQYYHYIFGTEEFKEFKKKVYYNGIMSVGLPLPNDIMRHIIMNYI